MESSLGVLDACLTHFTSGGKVDTPCLFYTDTNRKGFTCLVCPDCANVPVVSAMQRNWPRNRHFDPGNSIIPNDYALEFHSSEARHEENRNQLLLDLSCVKRVMQRYARLSLPHLRDKIASIHQISDISWRNAVQASLYRYLMSPIMRASLDSMNEPVERDETLEEALNAVRSFEYWDHSAILACAVWKAQCLLQMPESDNGGGLLAQLQWERSGWKTQKPQQRESEAISTILSAVRPFLDPLHASCALNKQSPSGGEVVVSPMQFQSSDKALIEYIKLYSASPPFMRSRVYEYHEATECLLCQRQNMDENARKFHFFDGQHKEREQQLKRDLVKMRKIMRRVVQLGTPPLTNILAVLQQVRVPSQKRFGSSVSVQFLVGYEPQRGLGPYVAHASAGPIATVRAAGRLGRTGIGGLEVSVPLANAPSMQQLLDGPTLDHERLEDLQGGTARIECHECHCLGGATVFGSILMKGILLVKLALATGTMPTSLSAKVHG
jgi:hypothetical protein